MQAVMLCAGKSTRTYPLTLTRPKPLLKVANKTLLEHNLENLLGIVDEVILIVGYKKDMIKKHIGKKYKNIKIKYVEQKEQLGTAHALLMAESFIKDRFIMMAGDDLYSGPDIARCAKHRYSVMASKVKNPQIFGVIVAKNNYLVDFVEKPKKFISNLAGTSFYCIDKNIFGCIRKIRKSPRGEYEMPDAIKLLSNDLKIKVIVSRKWIPIGYPWDLLKADKILRGRKNIIGRNSKTKGSIKNSAIGNDCIINGVVKDSIIMDNTTIGKNSIIESSVIGQNVSFSGKIKAKDNAYSMVKGKQIKASRLGAIIGDNVKASNVEIAAGCKISPGKSISNKKIYRDIT